MRPAPLRKTTLTFRLLSVINDCVHRFLSPGDCNDRLNNVTNIIQSPAFADELIQTLTIIVEAGQKAGGASPAASFQVYIAGYVQFWNDNDHGCDDQAWNVWPFDSPRLYLTTGFRNQMNILVDQLNAAIQSVANSLNQYGVFYVDHTTFQHAFDTHRFCEPDSVDDPTTSKTWFWHWAGPKFKQGTEGAVQASDNITYQDILNTLIPDQSVQATVNANNPPWTVDSKDLGSIDNFVAAANTALELNSTSSYLLEQIYRMFHPKGTAYGAYANSFLTTIQNNRGNAAAAATTSTSTAPVSTGSYVPGTCCFHVDEYEDCNAETDDLYANITIKDGSNNIIYTTPSNLLDNSGLGEPINVGNGSTFGSNPGPLPNPIQITGEHKNDYIQFTYGSLSWTSRDKTGVANCTNGGWDPRDGPLCYISIDSNGNPKNTLNEHAENQVDCCFPC